MIFSRAARCLVAVLAWALLPITSYADSAPLTAAKVCRKTISKEAARYTKKREMLLLACVDKFLKCEVLLEVDGTNPNTCRSSAHDLCQKKLTNSDSTLAKAEAKFDDKAGLACLAMSYTDVKGTGSGQLWYGNDATCGTSVDLPTLLDCVRGRLAARVDALVSEVKPRAGILLDNEGLGGSFPNLTRPPMTDVVISATAPASGVLVNPGTINVPQGNGLRFTGDPTTLPCGGGMGQNGRVTITVGSGSTEQTLTIRQNYGPTEVAIFGPYTATATIPYTLDLKDGSCMDSTSGNVSVP